MAWASTSVSATVRSNRSHGALPDQLGAGPARARPLACATGAGVHGDLRPVCGAAVFGAHAGLCGHPRYPVADGLHVCRGIVLLCAGAQWLERALFQPIHPAVPDHCSWCDCHHLVLRHHGAGPWRGAGHTRFDDVIRHVRAAALAVTPAGARLVHRAGAGHGLEDPDRAWALPCAARAAAPGLFLDRAAGHGHSCPTHGGAARAPARPENGPGPIAGTNSHPGHAR